MGNGSRSNSGIRENPIVGVGGDKGRELNGHGCSMVIAVELKLFWLCMSKVETRFDDGFESE